MKGKFMNYYRSKNAGVPMFLYIVDATEEEKTQLLDNPDVKNCSEDENGKLLFHSQQFAGNQVEILISERTGFPFIDKSEDAKLESIMKGQPDAVKQEIAKIKAQEILNSLKKSTSRVSSNTPEKIEKKEETTEIITEKGDDLAES